MDLMILSKLCPEVKTIVDRYIEAGFLTVLHTFVLSPTDLLDCMDETGSVVSGSVALWFVLGGSTGWIPNNLDIYCPSYTTCTLVKFLQEQEGYAENAGSQRTDTHDYSTLPSIDPSIYSITRLVHSKGRRIDIIESLSPSALHPIVSGWTTLLPNYVSARTLCIPYPYHVLARTGCFAQSQENPSYTYQIIEKYVSRGFAMLEYQSGLTPGVARAYPDAPQDCAQNPYCPHHLRSFGDKWCLQYTFRKGMEGQMDRVECLIPKWRFGGDKCGGCGRNSNREVKLVAR